MNILCTGLTGNLGQEIAKDLNSRNHKIYAITRDKSKLKKYKVKINTVIEHDLLSDNELEVNFAIDCIVHCAGNVHFRDTGNDNEKMALQLIKLAKQKRIPLFLVSTAYIYRPDNNITTFNNAYEQDKYNAEQQLINSGLKYGIFRPSILVGNSKTGEIHTMSGYYSIVKALYLALSILKSKKQKIRFPKLNGKSNLVPIDQAAFHIGEEIDKQNFKTHYITNPKPPDASWVLSETLNYFGLSEQLELIDLSFEQFTKIDLSIEEQKMYKFISHYYPYLILNTSFPTTICIENLINHNYLQNTLKYLKQSGFLKYDK